MLTFADNTRLPDKPEYPGLADTAGIGLDTLKSLKQEWLTDFDWIKEQESINE